ncbi:MAG: hypothetical protein ACJ785_09000 [Gemmatimonadaceae bacterium]
MLVQTVEPDARLSVAPAGIVPTRAADPALVRVTVLPLDVTEVVGRVVVVGVRVVVRGAVVRGAVVVRVGVVALGAAAVVEAAGTSVRAGCAALSRFAS